MTKFFNSKFFAGILKPVFVFLAIGILSAFSYQVKIVYDQPDKNTQFSKNDSLLFRKIKRIDKSFTEKNIVLNSRIDQTQDSIMVNLRIISEDIKSFKIEQFKQKAKLNLMLDSRDDVNTIKKTLKAIFGEETTENTN